MNGKRGMGKQSSFNILYCASALSHEFMCVDEFYDPGCLREQSVRGREDLQQ